MATGSPAREFTTEELDAMAAAELPAFDRPAPAATPAPMRGPAMGPVAQLEANREYSTEELDLLEKSSTPPPPQEFTTDELDQEAVRLFDDPTYAPTRDEYFDLKATKERLKAEGKIPGTAELAAKAVGGLFVTAIDAVNSTIFSPAETLAKSPATLQTGIGRAALGAMQLGGWAAEAMQGAPKYRDEDTGEFFHFTDPDSRQLQQALDAGRKLRPTTDEDLKDYEFENYIAKKGIDAEYQALGEKTAPTELLTRLITGRNQQETPNIAQAGALEIVADPTNLIPFGAGAKTLGLSRLGKIVSAQTAGVIGKVAGGVADAGDAMAARFADVVTNTTGLTPSTAGNVVKTLTRTSVGGGLAAGAATLGAPPEVTTAIAGFYPAYKAGIGVLRKIETGAGAAKIILRESADATNGLDQAARAAVLANPSVPQVFKEVLERPTNFIPIESTPARLAAEQSLSPQMRGLMGKLSNPAIVQSVRGASALAKGAVKGTAINAPFALLAANAGDDEEAAAMLGAGAAFGAAGAGVDRFTGLQQRRQQAAISDVSRMLVDVELAGGDVGKLMSTQTPESLVKLASLQGTFRNGLEFIPLNAADYNANVSANGGAGSAGLFVQAPAGQRAKVYINLDAKRQGIEPHEFGHALLASGALDGQQKYAARAWVDKTYGADGIKARAAEYAANIIRAKNAEAFPDGNFDITPGTLASEMDNLSQGGLARGDMDALDWARDEIFAETFAKASETMDFNAIRRGAPTGSNFLTFAEGILGAQARALTASGVRIDPQTGAPLEKPADLFAKNPLLATDKKLVNQLGTYINNYRQWANNPGHEKPAGVRVAPSGRASDIANNPQVSFYDRGDGIKANAFAIQDPATGQAILRDQRDLNAEHAKVREQLRALGGSKLLEPSNPVLGPKKTADGRVVTRGKVLPPQFDFLNGFMPHIRNFARQFEQFGQTGESMQVRYHAIGSGDTGAFRIKNLGNLEAITREVIPFEWQLTKAGNLNAVVLDLTQFRNRAMRAINNRNEALAPFNFEIGQLETDLKQWMDNHRNNLPGETKIGTDKRDALNALVGLATNQNRAKNPLNGAFGPGSAIKQFRLDRVDAAIGTGRQGFHFDYDKANGNRLPEIASPLPNLTSDIPVQAMSDSVPVRFSNKDFIIRHAGLVTMPGQAFPAYHGTPHKVDRFSTEKIGTGEGAQVYGWGLYFAENEKVANSYKSMMDNIPVLTIRDRNRNIIAKNESVSSGMLEASKWIEAGKRMAGQFPHNTGYYAKKAFEDSFKRFPEYLQNPDNQNVLKALDEIINNDYKIGYEQHSGNLYTVDLDVEPEDLLDWDKPLHRQSEKIQQSVAKARGDIKDWRAAFQNQESGLWGRSGAASYMDIQLARKVDMAGASKALLAAGIPGIRYLDGGSRGYRATEWSSDQAKTKYADPAFTEGIVQNYLESTQGDLALAIRYLKESAPEQFQIAANALEAGDIVFKPTYNYVIFDENLIKITNENGTPVTPQGQAMPDLKMPDGRILDNWSKVKDGDNWNTVKKFLPRENVDPPARPIGRSKDEIVESVAKFLSEIKSVEDRKGARILLSNPQTRGGYSDKLKNRAEHAVGRELQKGSNIRDLDPEKVAWIAAVPETIRNAPVKVHTGSEVLYYRKYRKKTHMVVTTKEGVFLDQEPFDSGFVTQYPLELRERQFKGVAKVEVLPPPAAVSGSPTNAATNATPATTDAVVQAGSVGTPGSSNLSSIATQSRAQSQAMPDMPQQWDAPLYEPLPKEKTTLRLHHGTWRGGYEKFAEGTHFSRSKEYASRYMHPSASSMGISGLKEAKIQEVISADVTFDNLFDTRNAADRKIFEREFYRKYGTGTPIGERGLPDWTDAVDLAEFLEENHSQYDGIVVDEGAEPLGNGEVRIRPEGFVPLKNAKIQIIERTPMNSNS